MLWTIVLPISILTVRQEASGLQQPIELVHARLQSRIEQEDKKVQTVNQRQIQLAPVELNALISQHDFPVYVVTAADPHISTRIGAFFRAAQHRRRTGHQTTARLIEATTTTESWRAAATIDHIALHAHASVILPLL